MVFLSSENHPDIGAIAQLGEHLLCKQGVRGSIPRSSTMLDKSIMNFVFLPNLNLRSNSKTIVKLPLWHVLLQIGSQSNTNMTSCLVCIQSFSIYTEHLN